MLFYGGCNLLFNHYKKHVKRKFEFKYVRWKAKLSLMLYNSLVLRTLGRKQFLENNEARPRLN